MRAVRLGVHVFDDCQQRVVHCDVTGSLAS